MRYGFWVLVAAVLLALWCSEPPQPKLANVSADQFSAGRAFLDIEKIAQRPHPVGSADHARVKAYLVSRLAAMGLKPEVEACRSTQGDDGRLVSAPVENVIGILKGADSAAPALLIMSHYDTVPDSPGAADDTAGVAAALEIARAMKTQGTPPRDVVFLFSDGEELGLMGAGAFFRSPLARHIGAVINFDVRGDAGPAFMYETGPQNSEAVSLWRQKVARPLANSLATAIYKRMPNGTDFTWAVKAGLPGLNFAFLGDEAAYHSGLATPAHLNLGSVQHLGDNGLAAAEAFAAQLPGQSGDAVYSDVLGFFLVQYDVTTGWILFAITAVLVLYAIFAAQAITDFAWGRGFAGALLALILPPLLLYLAGLSFGSMHHFLRLSHFDFLLAGAGLLAIGGGLFGAALFTARRPPAVWQWLLLIELLCAALLQVYVPEGAFALVWPLLAAGLIGVIRFGFYHGDKSPVPALLSVILAIPAIAQVLMFGIFAFTALGVSVPLVLAVSVLIVLPLLLLMPGKLPARTLPVLLMAFGAGLFAYGRLAPASEDKPAPSLIRYVVNQNSGKAYLTDYLNTGDSWSKEALGSEAAFGALPWMPERQGWFAETRAVAVPKTDLIFARDGANLMIVAKTRPDAISATVLVRPAAEIGGSSVEGTATVLKAGVWNELRYYKPETEDLVWTMPLPKAGPLEVVVIALYPSWPSGVAALPPLPSNKLAFANYGTTEVVLSRVWKP